QAGVELGLLREELSGSLGGQRSLSVGNPCIQVVAGHGVLEAGKALYGFEALFLGLLDGGERFTIGIQPGIGIEGTVGHVQAPEKGGLNGALLYLYLYAVQEKNCIRITY